MNDRVDYWAVDFDDMSRKEIIHVPKDAGLERIAPSPPAPLPEGEGSKEIASPTGRGRRAAPGEGEFEGGYTVAVKVIDIFGNDTMALVPVSVG